MIIALTGFMGCGKSSVGRELSTLLGIPVVDLDQYIVERIGKSIPDIFAESGESGFRDIETAALAELIVPGGSPSETSCCAGPLPSDDGPLPLTVPRVARFSGTGHSPDSVGDPPVLKLICCCYEGEEKRVSIGEVLSEWDVPVPEIVVLIGPEGDFSREEVALALECGFRPVHLGPSRLRTETAALAAVAAVYFHYCGDKGM